MVELPWYSCFFFPIFILTRPTKNRTATFAERTSSYCIQVLRTAIRRLKLFAVEKTPMKRSTCRSMGTGGAFNVSKSMTCLKSSVVGRPLAITESNLMSPAILTSPTNPGSISWRDQCMKCKNKDKINHIRHIAIYWYITTIMHR